jgi:hypothetical protein
MRIITGDVSFGSRRLTSQSVPLAEAVRDVEILPKTGNAYRRHLLIQQGVTIPHFYEWRGKHD